MDNLYDFITLICKERDMRLEDLQNKLGVSRSTLYRYMKGINQIIPELESRFVGALNMDAQTTLAFSKLVSQSAFDQSLVQSRYAIDDFLFGKQPGHRAAIDINMVFYHDDKYLRTLREMLNFIASFRAKEDVMGIVKIMNCLNENILIHIKEFLQTIACEESRVEVEHFVELSETDYLQNTYSFIDLFPLMKNERYRLYFREAETDDSLANDSFLISFQYRENGILTHQFFTASFYEDDMPACIAFSDVYMYSFLSKRYENLKHSYKNVIRKQESFNFESDVIMELSRRGSNYTIKPNPCYDKIPYNVYERLLARSDKEDTAKFLSEAYGRKLESEEVTSALEAAVSYIKKRIDATRVNKQIDVYSKKGMLEFAATGRITDHLDYFPAFSKAEIRMTLEYLRGRCNDPNDDYRFYITENELFSDDLVITAIKGYGIAIEYIYPDRKDGLWKISIIESKRLSSILCDYIENYIPLHHAMAKDKADCFLLSLPGKQANP